MRRENSQEKKSELPTLVEEEETNMSQNDRKISRCEPLNEKSELVLNFRDLYAQNNPPETKSESNADVISIETDSSSLTTSEEGVVALSRGQSFRSSIRSDVGVVRSVASPGVFGEISVQASSEVHFGNKVYTAPITVVNNVGGASDLDNDELWKDPLKKPDISFWARFQSRSSNLLEHRFAVIVISILIITIFTTIGSIFLLIEFEYDWPPDIDINEKWFVNRGSWNTISYSQIRREPLKLPISFVIIEHTGTNNMYYCCTRKECDIKVKAIQNLHINYNQWQDIAYNYLVGSCDEGLVYEGRGSNVIGAHAIGYNYRSIGIAFMGDYNIETPSESQLNHTKRLIEEAVKAGKVAENYVLVGSCQVARPNSPGKNVMDEIKTWKNYDVSRICSN